jgi:stalled ribosome alternative rescue factor ArfA
MKKKMYRKKIENLKKGRGSLKTKNIEERL